MDKVALIASFVKISSATEGTDEVKGIRHALRNFTATAVREHLRSAVENGNGSPVLTPNELALVREVCEGPFDWRAFLAEQPHV